MIRNWRVKNGATPIAWSVQYYIMRIRAEAGGSQTAFKRARGRQVDGQTPQDRRRESGIQVIVEGMGRHQ